MYNINVMALSLTHNAPTSKGGLMTPQNQGAVTSKRQHKALALSRLKITHLKLKKNV